MAAKVVNELYEKVLYPINDAVKVLMVLVMGMDCMEMFCHGERYIEECRKGQMEVVRWK
jgi:hypothetical protein